MIDQDIDIPCEHELYACWQCGIDRTSNARTRARLKNKDLEIDALKDLNERYRKALERITYKNEWPNGEACATTAKKALSSGTKEEK